MMDGWLIDRMPKAESKRISRTSKKNPLQPAQFIPRVATDDRDQSWCSIFFFHSISTTQNCTTRVAWWQRWLIKRYDREHFIAWYHRRKTRVEWYSNPETSEMVCNETRMKFCDRWLGSTFPLWRNNLKLPSFDWVGLNRPCERLLYVPTCSERFENENNEVTLSIIIISGAHRFSIILIAIETNDNAGFFLIEPM